MGAKQSNTIEKKKFSYEFGYEFIRQDTAASKCFPVDYTYNKQFPTELSGVITEPEYHTIGKYLYFITGNGSPEFQYLTNVMVFVFCFFLPLIMMVNHVCLKWISFYILVSALLNLFISLPYFIYLIVKSFKLKREVNKILKEKSIQLKRPISINKFALLYIIIVYAQSFLEVYWFSNYYYYGNTVINTLVHYFIGLDVFIIFFFIYNYCLFSKCRGIFTSKYQVGNDEEYLQLLNNNIKRYILTHSCYLEYAPVQVSQSSTSPIVRSSMDYDINDIDVEQKQELLLNPYV